MTPLRTLQIRSIIHVGICPKACVYANSGPTLSNRLRSIYLAAPLDAEAGAEVKIGLSPGFQPHFVGAVYRYAMEVFAGTQRW